MFGTKTLSSLKDFLPKIHHPLPLNQYESQQLLKALTTSFRKNLDKEHGFGADDGPLVSLKPASISSPSSPSKSAKSSSSSAHSPHHRPTDSHVRAILSSPLFSYNRSQSNPMERDPMDVFDEAVSKGLMTPQRAAGVLKAKRQAITQSSTLSVNETMATSGTALRVLQWLRSSGLERDLSFIEVVPLIDNLVPFMVEEHLEEVAWNWLDRLMGAKNPALGINTKSPASSLLKALVRTKTSHANKLDSGYACILQAQDMFNKNSAFEANVISPWRALSWWSTVSAWQLSRPSETLFDAFAAMSTRLEKLKGSIHVDRAHLDLHHPTHPDATPAVNLLESDSIKHLLAEEKEHMSHHDNFALKYDTLTRRVALMAMDAAQHLMRVGRVEEARRVRDVLLTNLGPVLGPRLQNFRLAFSGSPLRAG